MSLKLSMVVGAVLAVAAAAVSARWWDALPAQVPTHFDLHGHANGYQSRAVFAVVLPAAIALVAPMFALLARISPRGWDLRGSASTVGVIAVAVAAFLLAIHGAIVRAAVTHGEPKPAFILFAVGALVAVLGNRFGKVRRNFFIGIRTPWTLADEEVWLRTHRLAGKVFVGVGLAMMAASQLGTAGLVALAPVLLAASLVPVVYSFVIYRRMHAA